MGVSNSRMEYAHRPVWYVPEQHEADLNARYEWLKCALTQPISLVGSNTLQGLIPNVQNEGQNR